MNMDPSIQHKSEFLLMLRKYRKLEANTMSIMGELNLNRALFKKMT